MDDPAAVKPLVSDVEVANATVSDVPVHADKLDVKELSSSTEPFSNASNSNHSIDSNNIISNVSPLRGGSDCADLDDACFDDCDNNINCFDVPESGTNFKETDLVVNGAEIKNDDDDSTMIIENRPVSTDVTCDVVKDTEAVSQPKPDLLNLVTDCRPEILSETSKTTESQQPGPSCAASDATSTNSKSRQNASSPSVYQIKIIDFKNKKIPIITQNENGPCPLIAIMNVMSMRGVVKLPTTSKVISSEQVMEYLGHSILEHFPKNIRDDAQLNFEQNMHDAIAVLPKLQTGLDVNVRFTGVKDFEYTPECIVFDLLNIPMYHGWLVEVQSPELQAAVSSCTYNQLVEKIIEDTTSNKPELVHEALLAENFLERTASQLTYHGLCELNSTMKEEELAVLFRNNHFITLYKRQNELFQLVTDQGFIAESTVVWETLSNIEGDGQFVDGNFLTVPPAATVSTVNVDLPPEQQIDQDYLVALTLQEDQKKQDDRNKSWNEYKHNTLGIEDEITDEELARRMQEEEEENAATTDGDRQKSNSGRSAAAAANKSKKSDCTIL